MNALLKLKQMAEDTHGIYFYITDTEKRSIQVFNKIKDSVDYAWWVSANAVNSVTLDNGSEITILPEDDAHELLALPHSSAVFIESEDDVREMADALRDTTDVLALVDPTSQELL
jgi:hypothetical protein